MIITEFYGDANFAMLLKNMLMGFFESVLRFCQGFLDFFFHANSAILLPKWASDILVAFHAPNWLVAFARGDWFTFLITNLFSTILIGLLMFKITMRLIQLISPLT